VQRHNEILMSSSRKVLMPNGERLAVFDRPRPVSTTFVWRRLHGGNIIAEASPVRGMGSWTVSAYSTSWNADPVHGSGSYTFLRDAHAAADELVRTHFHHTCRTGVCGRWLRWPED
jgi:hypothetical protein